MRRISTPGANGEQNCLRSVRKGWQSSVGDGKIKRKADRGRNDLPAKTCGFLRGGLYGRKER